MVATIYEQVAQHLFKTTVDVGLRPEERHNFIGEQLHVAGRPVLVCSWKPRPEREVHQVIFAQIVSHEPDAGVHVADNVGIGPAQFIRIINDARLDQ